MSNDASPDSLRDEPLHPRLADLLTRLAILEQTATGSLLRPTYRLTRQVLGTSVELGVPVEQLADCLGRRRASIGTRVQATPGTISRGLIRELTGMTPEELDRLSGGALTGLAQGDNADEHYPVADFVRALLHTPRT